jgi:hypothetical protein
MSCEERVRIQRFLPGRLVTTEYLTEFLAGDLPTPPGFPPDCDPSTVDPLLPIPFFFTLMRTLLHIFAPRENSTRLLSCDCALFAKKHGVGREVRASAHLNWLSFTSSDKIASPPAPRAQTHQAR